MFVVPVTLRYCHACLTIHRVEESISFILAHFVFSFSFGMLKALHRLGKKDVPVYDGSWTEWALRPVCQSRRNSLHEVAMNIKGWRVV